MMHTFFDKETGSGVNVKEVLVPELNKLVRFKNNIWTGNLDEMRSLSSFNRRAKYVLCVLDIFTKYGWVKQLTDKKG